MWQTHSCNWALNLATSLVQAEIYIAGVMSTVGVGAATEHMKHELSPTASWQEQDDSSCSVQQHHGRSRISAAAQSTSMIAGAGRQQLLSPTA